MLTLFLALVVSFQSRPGLVPDAVIVGRAVCNGNSWLITEAPDLIEVSAATRTVEVHPLRGLDASDKVWGLACLADGSLWTLASPLAMVRLDERGMVRERIRLNLPRIGLFGASDRLLVQQMPIAPGAPLLVSTPPRQPEIVREWPGLVARTGHSREQQIALNLVNCGVGFARTVPCWLPEEASVSISDGTTARLLSVAALSTPPIERSRPIRDVALITAHTYWLLGTTAPEGRREGGRLFRSRSRAGTGGMVDAMNLQPAARIIAIAAESTCLVVTVNGGLMEVEAKP
jgi:hypothetical protein